MNVMSVDVLVGRFFHTTRRCPSDKHTQPEWQGHIVGAPSPTVLLIRTFDWITGMNSEQQLITFEDFMARNPVLYDDDSQMRFSSERGRLKYCACGEDDT